MCARTGPKFMQFAGSLAATVLVQTHAVLGLTMPPTLLVRNSEVIE